MDDLLQHCMRELAFDGDLGCDVSRLRHFIESFYASQDSPDNQTVDHIFHAFVWSLLVQQPSVRVGLVPQGSAVEVYIAPQPRRKNKITKSEKKRLASENFIALPPEVEDAAGNEDAESSPGGLQPIEGVSASSLNDLMQQYGNGLRVAVDPEMSFRAITGSHARPAKLSPMVYTALQFISREREAGLSVIDLGKKTGYDQKTCFYLIKQLCELDLVVKLSQGGVGGGNFCIHKYFFTRSFFWEEVRREEATGEDAGNSEQQSQSRDEGSADPRGTLQFDPIDSRHLASIQLLRSRLLRLLKHSENGLHTYQNLLVTLGFSNPTKRDRRFFIVRIRELIKEGFIEKVIVPKVYGKSKTLCVRLVGDGRTPDIDGTTVQPIDVGDDEQETIVSEKRDVPVVNLTIHRQILQLLQDAAHGGLTINDISTRLGNFDKRTVELLLSRMERTPPPPHLADLTICEFLEHQGRERHHRYYTLPGYLSFIHRENLDHTGRTTQYTSMDISHSGGFLPLNEDLFYGERASLVTCEDGSRDRAKPRKGGTRKLGRPRKDDSTSRHRNNMPDEDRETPVARLGGKRRKGQKGDLDSQADDEVQKPMQKVQICEKRKRNIDIESGEDESRPSSKRKGSQPSETASGQCEAVLDGMEAAEEVTSGPAPMRIRGRQRNGGKVGPGRRASLRVSTCNPEPRQYIPASPTSSAARESTHSDEPNGSTLAAAGLDTFVAAPTPLPMLELPVASQIGIVTMDDGRNDLRFISSTTEILQNASLTESHVIVNPQAGSKRGYDMAKEDVADGESPPPKRSKSGRSRSHALINISQMRAENEFMRVVAAAGGITNINSKEFLDTHASIVALMADAGEPTSMQIGTQPDRRTIRKIFERLEERGRLKILTVTVTPNVGQPRVVKLAYELGVTQERLDRYLVALREEVPTTAIPAFKMLEQPTNFTRPKVRQTRNAEDGLPDSENEKGDWKRDVHISDMDDDAIRSSILSEIQTVAQLYGFLVGRAKRARELHLFTLAHLQGKQHSPYIVSPVERIVTLPYYFNDLPVSTYFAIISVTGHSAELSALTDNPQGRQVLVKDLPPDLDSKLKIGHARARDKILELFGILTSLKLVTPLQPSTNNDPHLVCEANGGHPTRFDVISISDTRMIAPTSVYWRFNTIAPIYMYSMTEPWPPPFCRDVPVGTADESISFWFELENACLNKDNIQPTTFTDSITGPCLCSLEVARGLRRSRSWISSYLLSWQQKEYLRRWTDPSTGYTPLSDADGGQGCLTHVCHVISAPVDAVYEFFRSSHLMFLMQTERIQEKKRKSLEERKGRKDKEVRGLLAKKAAEARRQLEADWDALLLRMHPTPVPYGSGTRLKQLRTQYMQSRATMDNQKWEAAVLEAVSGSRSAKRNSALSKIAAMPHKMSHRVSNPRLPPAAVNRQKSVAELIERQKDRVATFQAIQPQKSKKGAFGDSDTRRASIDSPRRQRFQWTYEYDELARDASAIIKSRCRTWHRMDWTALDQLFPFLPRNNVRQRIVILRQEAGAESYLRLLEDKWHELWVEHRGTEALPDHNPTHPSEFDAIAHVEFLRKYIDKRALRVGLPNTDVHNVAGPILPETISEISSAWNIDEKPRPSHKMDIVWNTAGDEHREKAFLGEAFTLPVVCDVPTATHPLLDGVAESALKMTLTTPEEDYDINSATLLLNEIGKDAVRRASKELLARGVISESRKSRGNGPGRKLKISSLNEDALGGSFHSDFYAEACAIEDIFDETSDWREWSMVTTDGEMAALIELVSTRKVEFQIDVSGPASQRQQLDWNSRKVDDEQITATLAVQFSPSGRDGAVLSNSLPESLSPTPMHVDEAASAMHGQNDGEPAPCRRTSQGIITCSACLDTDQEIFLATPDLESRRLSSLVMEKIDRAGWNGLSREELQVCLPQSQGIHAIVDQLTSRSNPQCYWVGYTYPVLVSRRHIRKWTIRIPGTSVPRLIFPRRWLNIKGERMEDLWNAGLRAIVGVLVIRPGISQAALRQRLISVYDRQEVNDMLQHLDEAGMIAREVSPENLELRFKDSRATDITEEQNICWKLTWNPWYRVNADQ